MNLKTLALPMACVYFLLISATTTNVRTLSAQTNNVAVPSRPANTIAGKKLNFFERLIFKVALRKLQKADVADADKLAGKSQTWGILAISSVPLALLFPPLLLFSLIASIIAMSAGRRALKGNTKETGKARLGKGLGLAVLIAASILTVALILFIATFSLD